LVISVRDLDGGFSDKVSSVDCRSVVFYIVGYDASDQQKKVAQIFTADDGAYCGFFFGTYVRVFHRSKLIRR